MKTSWRQFCEDRREETFAPFYERSKQLVYTLCRRVLRDEDDAMDAFQGVYDRLLAVADDPEERGRIDDVETFVLRLTIREADRLRKARQRRLGKEIAVNPLPEQPALQRSAPQLIEEQMRCARIEALLSTLPDRYRLPILLHYFDGLTYEQVARALGISQGTVRTQIHRALKRLRPLFRRAGLGEASLVLAGLAATSALLDPPAAAAAGVVLAHAQAAVAAGTVTAAGSVAVIGASSLSSLVSPASSLWNSLTGIILTKLHTVVAGAVCLATLVALLVFLGPSRGSGPTTRPSRPASSPPPRVPLELSPSTPSVPATGSGSSIDASSTLGAAAWAHLPIAAEDTPSTGPRMEFTGRVLLAGSHAPAAGATVEVVMQGGDSSKKYMAKFLYPFRVMASTRADDEGRYLLSVPDTRDCSLVAHRPGSASVMVWYFKDNARSIEDFDVSEGMIRRVRRDFLLPPASELAGQVVDEDAHPIADAEIAAFRLGKPASSIWQQTSARSDPGGQFNLTDVPAGQVTLAVAAPGYVPSESVCLAPERKAVVRLSRKGVSLSGRIFHADSGGPVGGVELQVRPSDASVSLLMVGANAFKAVTAPDGAFRFDRLPAGRCSLLLTDRGMEFAPGQDDMTKDFTLGPGDHLDSLELRVIEKTEGTAQQGEPVARTRVSGRVVRPDGLPLDDGILEAYCSPDGDFNRQPAVTLYPLEPDGRFAIDVALPSRLRLQGRARGFAPTPTEILDVTSSSSPLSGIRIVLTPGCSVEGTVVDVDGQPVGDVSVTLWDGVSIRSSSRSFVRWAATSDGAGHFVLEGIPPGMVSINLERDGYAFLQDEVALDASQPVTSVRFTLEKGHFLAGKVTDEDGNPVEDVRVNVNPMPDPDAVARHRVYMTYVGRTDAWGAYRIEDIPGGRSYGIQATAEGVEAFEPVESLDQENLDLVLRPKERPVFAGTVVDFRTGDPIPTFQAAADGSGLRVNKDADRPGVFRVHGMYAGQATRLTISAPGYATIHDRPIRAGRDNTVTAEVIRMGPGATISGRAVDAEGRAALTGVRAVLRSYDSNTLREGARVLAQKETDAEGYFQFESVAAGSYSVSLIPPEPHAEVRVQKTVGLEDNVALGDIEVGEGCRIFGRVIHRPGDRGVAGADLTLSSLGVPLKTVTTDADGSYEFSGLVNRPYGVSSRSFKLGFGSLYVSPGSRVEVDVIVGDTTLRGKVETEHLQTIGSVNLVREDQAGKDWAVGRGIELDDNGRFTVEGLAAGRYVLEVYCPSRPDTWRQTIDIPESGIVEKTFDMPLD